MIPVMVGRLRRHSTVRKPRKIAGRNGWCDPPQPATFVALLRQIQSFGRVSRSAGTVVLRHQEHVGSGHWRRMGSRTLSMIGCRSGLPHGNNDGRIQPVVPIAQVGVWPPPQAQRKDAQARLDPAAVHMRHHSGGAFCKLSHPQTCVPKEIITFINNTRNISCSKQLTEEHVDRSIQAVRAL